MYIGDFALYKMGSKGRIPLPHGRRTLPGFGVLHPEAFVHGLRPPPGVFLIFISSTLT